MAMPPAEYPLPVDYLPGDSTTVRSHSDAHNDADSVANQLVAYLLASPWGADIAAAFAAHLAAGDPHPQYLTAAEGNAAYDALGAAATVATDLSNHLADAVDAHDASAISVVPFATIAATTVQAALEEILAEESPGVTDHGALTGLGDDDHPQYVKDAGDTMTGTLVMDQVGIQAKDSGGVARVEVIPGTALAATELHLRDEAAGDLVVLTADPTVGGSLLVCDSLNSQIFEVVNVFSTHVVRLYDDGGNVKILWDIADDQHFKVDTYLRLWNQTADPPSPQDGDVLYRSDTDRFRVRANAAWQYLAFVSDLAANMDGNARVAVSKNSGATVGTRRRINLIEGSNITLTVADDAGNEEVDVTIAASGGGGGLTQAQALALTMGS